MTATPITSPEQWHAMRNACVATASTVAALIAPHPFETPLSVYMRALGGADPIAENEAMAAGLDAELMMPARVRRMRPDLDLKKMNLFFRHPKLRFGGTPDFTDQYDGNWQGKCVDPGVFFQEWQAEPPLWVLIQHQAEYLLTGRETGGVVCLVRDRLFSTLLHEVDAHEGTMRAIERAVAEMEERVANREPPPPDFQRDAELLGQLHRHATKGKTVDMSHDNRLVELAATYMRHSNAIDGADEARKAIKAEILTKIGDASKVLVNGYVIGAPEVAASPDKVITADMVGSTIKGRSGYRRVQITSRTE